MPNYVIDADGVWKPISYTVKEVDEMYRMIPVSRFGDVDDNPIAYAGAGNNLSIGKDIPVLLGGKLYTIKAGNISFAGLANGNYNLYVKLNAGVIGIVYSSDILSEAITQMYVGRLTMAGGNVSIGSTATYLEKVTRIDTYRLSPTKRGSSIPVSTGPVTGAGTYLW